MMIWLTATILCGIYLLPLTIQIDLAHSGDTRGRVLFRCWKLHKAWRWEQKQGDGQQDMRQKRLLRRLLQSDHRAWRYLLHHIRLLQLDGQALLRTGDAARSALLAGTLRTLCVCIPPLHRKEIRLQILPEFFREHSTINLRCMIRLKLGTLILTAMLLGVTLLQQQKESEAMQYGTSHW